MIVDLDGTAHLFGGRAGFSTDDGRLILSERYVAGNITRFLAILGSLYERAGYLGPVDVGVGVTGLKDALSSADLWGAWPSPYPRPEYRRTRRLTAVELEREPRRAAMELVGRRHRGERRSALRPLQGHAAAGAPPGGGPMGKSKASAEECQRRREEQRRGLPARPRS